MNKIAKNDDCIELIPAGIEKNDALTAFGKLMDFARETEITRRERAKARAARDVMIHEITNRYDFYRELLIKTFAERDKIIEKNFEIIDKGIKENDYSLINMGLKAVTEIVKESPFAKIDDITNRDERRNMLESGELSVI